MTEEQIQKGLDRAYKEAGDNAYFGEGFRAGVKFANDNNQQGLLIKPKIADLTIGQKVDAILLWQNSREVHPLTCGCGATNNDEKKFEIIATRINGKPIFIECSRCGVVQDRIPDCVYQYYIDSNFKDGIDVDKLKQLMIDADSLLTLFAFSELIFNKNKEERKNEAKRIGFGLRNIYEKILKHNFTEGNRNGKNNETN